MSKKKELPKNPDQVRKMNHALKVAAVANKLPQIIDSYITQVGEKDVAAILKDIIRIRRW